MKGRALAVVALSSIAGEACAHTVLGFTGFTGGLLHPLLVPSHVMAWLALALAAGQRQQRKSVPLAYALGLLVGLGAIALAYVPRFAEEALLALAVVTGLVVASACLMPLWCGVVLAIATGLAIGLDSPPETISIAEANRTLLGTAVSGIVLMLAVVWLASHLGRAWQQIGIRIAGSWIAASASLVLALRFALG
jgi:urease accessory protein